MTGFCVVRLIFLVCLAVLSGCVTTDAYRDVSAACSADAVSRFPVRNQRQTFTESYVVDVPTGETTCTTRPAVVDRQGVVLREGEVKCVELRRSETRYRDVERIVDVNYESRVGLVRQCVQARCEAEYGNDKCVLQVPRASLEMSAFEAEHILRGYFGEAWVQEPFGFFHAIGGNLCGVGGRGDLPLKEIEQVQIIYDEGRPIIMLNKFNWLKVWGPCGMLTYSIKGDFSQRDVERVVGALRSLGADL
jgi:hypothetical protein